jgi:hypothetical protein
LTTADFDPDPAVTFALTSAGGYDTFVSKLDTHGNFVWAKRMGGTSGNYGYSVAVDGAGNVYTAGYFEDTVDFDPDPAVTFALTSAGTADIFVSMLDTHGNFVWAKRMGGPSGDHGYSVAVDGAGNVYTTGHFQDTADFDPDPSVTLPLTSAGGADVFVALYRICPSIGNQSTYGRLLFPSLCTLDVSGLTEDVYQSTTVGINRDPYDAFYLSSDGMSFKPLVVDDEVYCNGQGSGLGPYSFQPDVPPFILNVPIENNLVPLPAHDITSLIPMGSSQVLFELVAAPREVYGNTPVYLVRDCGISLGKEPDPTLHWISHDVEINGSQSNLNVVTGSISDLRADGDFTGATCLGLFLDATQVVDRRLDPPAGNGYYYLVNGTCAQPIGYGDSSVAPDPRDGLAAICP